MKTFFIKKILIASVISLFFVQMIYVNFEPIVVIAATATDNVVVTLTVDTGISITSPADVVMAPNLGIGANGSIGSSSWTIKTNNAIGYTLAVKASAAPALVSGSNSFADYTEVTGGTPEVWNVAASNKEFGYSAFGSDTPTATWGTTATCGAAGVPNASMKYVGFKITDKTIASSATVTPSLGDTTTVCFAAEQDTVYAPSGVYTATITATATTL
jgi:hypothetical protein